VSLLPGLPEVKFSGLVDTAIKESATRLKSAFRKLGFRWPHRQQIIINISPAYMKKNSLGMDLALASAILWKTSQIHFNLYNSSEIYAYGEVTLDGEVRAPAGWNYLPFKNNEVCITGFSKDKNYRENNYLAETLKDLDKAHCLPVEPWKNQLIPPRVPDLYFSEAAHFLLKLAAAGEHNLLLCGEAGSGKTTLTENLYYLLNPPQKRIWEEYKGFFKAASWRPYINPHHTTTPLSIIGGGVPLFPGEISRAHGGLLVLDEYLEFHPKVQEALREPVEKGQIRLVRRGQNMTFPSRFLLAATSNLCPCGDYVPGKNNSCGYSLRRCQSYLDRLSGPMLDRFDLLAFSNQWKGKREISLKSIVKEVYEASQFRLETRKQTKMNSRLNLQELEFTTDQKILKYLPETSSYRRKQALLRVARTLSDLNKEEFITHKSIEKAFLFTAKNFHFLKNRMLIN
ncbi:MAG: ATP-binding protein, partial [Bdellovibrionales bacterium]